MKQEEIAGKITQLKAEIGKVLVGQHEVVDQVLQAIFAGGHCLMMGVPGLAKTLLVSTLSQALHLSFKRIQFTPDLMPSDITGSDIIQEGEDGHRHFVFIKGPLFANMVLADEINRTPPKTQAALLEAMQEHKVTVGNKSYVLDEPFFVLATQNPVEQEGTYNLPEAQQDRFMYFINVRYPERGEELEVINRTTGTVKQAVAAVLSGEDLIAMQKMVREVPIASHLVEYALDIVRATRMDRGQEGDLAPDFVRQYVEWGAGPRAAQYMVLGAKASALMEGRSHVTSADLKKVAYPVLSHRIIVNFAAQADRVTSKHIIDKILKHVPVPEMRASEARTGALVGAE
jgi:MoxR-like ATPase